jgi:hypothetical protein
VDAGTVVAAVSTAAVIATGIGGFAVVIASVAAA